jgi:hypothetical protein
MEREFERRVHIISQDEPGRTRDAWERRVHIISQDEPGRTRDAWERSVIYCF